MSKPAEKPSKPKFPSIKKKCRYCHCMFSTPPTYNGQNQEFCIEAHRKAFHKEGQKPIAAILKRQEKRMREIVREEISAVFRGLDGRYMSILQQVITEQENRQKAQSERNVSAA
jgi:hypothetical protein